MFETYQITDVFLYSLHNCYKLVLGSLQLK